MTDDRRPQPMQDPGDDDGQGDGHDGLDLTARMHRATAHVEGTGVRIDAVHGPAERAVVGARRRRYVAAAAVVALIAGGAVAMAVRGGDEPQEVTTADQPDAPEVGTADDPGSPDVEGSAPGETSGVPTDEVPTDEQPTRLLESGPTIPLGPCSETYPIPAPTIGLETRIRSYGTGQIVVELRNTTDEDMVVLNGGRYVVLGADGNLRSDLHLNEGYTSEDEDPPASVVVPAGGSGEIRTPIALVLSTASCDDTPSLYGDDPLVTEHEFVYVLGIEGSDEVYASEPDVLTINGDGSASCAQPLAEDGDCPLPPGWSSGS